VLYLLGVVKNFGAETVVANPVLENAQA